MAAIAAENIGKSFKEVTALDCISFTVDSNELFGFIGPDGAGKTTLFRILNTLLIPDSGKASMLGYDVVSDFKKIRSRVGYMPGRFSLYEDLTVEENLNFYASVFKTTVQENYDLVKDIYEQIEPFKKRRARKLSGGMKQKLALSCALIHKPDILVLDEPTTGVDAVSRKEFWEMLKNLQKQNITILVSTPYMDEAILCDRAALIQKGRLLNIDKPEKISGAFSTKLYAVKAEKKYKLLEALRDYDFAASVYPFGDRVHYTDTRGEVNPVEIQDYLKSKYLSDAEVSEIQPGIEDVFMDLMGEDSK